MVTRRGQQSLRRNIGFSRFQGHECFDPLSSLMSETIQMVRNLSNMVGGPTFYSADGLGETSFSCARGSPNWESAFLIFRSSVEGLASGGKASDTRSAVPFVRRSLPRIGFDFETFGA